MDLTDFSAAIGDVTTALGTTVLPAFAGLAVAGLGVTLAVRWIKRIRSAV